MIVDLRDYTTTPGGRDLLIERLERLFLDEQERLGATFLGTFRDAEREDRFVWLRAMPDLATRGRVLTEFYSEGALWRAHREEVNRWIADSDNVLLLRPLTELSPPARGESVVAMLSCVGRDPVPDEVAATWRGRVDEAIGRAGGRLLVTFRTDPAENNYPRHPIREGEHGLIWFATFAARPDRPLQTGVSVDERWLHPTPRSRIR